MAIETEVVEIQKCPAFQLTVEVRPNGSDERRDIFLVQEFPNGDKHEEELSTGGVHRDLLKEIVPTMIGTVQKNLPLFVRQLSPVT